MADEWSTKDVLTVAGSLGALLGVVAVGAWANERLAQHEQALVSMAVRHGAAIKRLEEGPRGTPARTWDVVAQLDPAIAPTRFERDLTEAEARVKANSWLDTWDEMGVGDGAWVVLADRERAVKKCVRGEGRWDCRYVDGRPNRG